MTYTCVGNVRGECGHKHRTIEGAVRCLRRDQKSCRSQGGYSDRGIARTDGRYMTEADYDEYMAVAQRIR